MLKDTCSINNAPDAPVFSLPPCPQMDIDVFFLHQQLDDMEDDEMKDAQRLAGTATAVILLGVIEAQRLRAERRRPNLVQALLEPKKCRRKVDVAVKVVASEEG